MQRNEHSLNNSYPFPPFTYNPFFPRFTTYPPFTFRTTTPRPYRSSYSIGIYASVIISIAFLASCITAIRNYRRRERLRAALRRPTVYVVPNQATGRPGGYVPRSPPDVNDLRYAPRPPPYYFSNTNEQISFGNPNYRPSYQPTTPQDNQTGGSVVRPPPYIHSNVNIQISQSFSDPNVNSNYQPPIPQNQRNAGYSPQQTVPEELQKPPPYNLVYN